MRRARPDIAFSSDFIVGFPGETEADFEATLALAREVGFASAYAFKYSPRPGTPAADAEEQIDAAIKAERLAALQQLLEAQRQAFNRATVGRRFGVIFDKPGRHAGQLIGRTPYMQSVHADADASRVGRTDRSRDHRRQAEFAGRARRRAARHIVRVSWPETPEEDHLI